MMPAAHAANANLFVSAENSQYNNYFGGAQVIEIVVNDSDIKETDESKGEPDVTVNGKIVRMVQGVDGLWYAYITDQNTSRIADDNQDTNGSDGAGLDFGKLCSNTSSVTGVDVSDSEGIWMPTQVTSGGTQGIDGDVGDVIPQCAGAVQATTIFDAVQDVTGATAIVRFTDLNQDEVADAGELVVLTSTTNFDEDGSEEDIVFTNRNTGVQVTLDDADITGDTNAGLLAAELTTITDFAAAIDAADDEVDNLRIINVVREEKDVSGQNNGQIGVTAGFWPFIQTYDFNPTGNVIVQYNKGSNVQTTSLTFDTLDGY